MSFSSNYHVVEPHPSTTSPYIHTARGGAGNVTKAPSSSSTTRASDATGPASRASLADPKQSSRTYISGRGGAGNVHPNSERAMFSFDEELERQMRQEKDLAPVYHVGRGGAGNMVYIDGSTRPRKSSAADNASARSTSSTESGADVATRNIRRSFEKGWSKMVGVGNYMTG